jgi:23S rRNA G2445 N2-methylase RlmL
MMALNIAPGLARASERAFLRWRDLTRNEKDMWDACVHEARAATRAWDGKPLILGNDIDPWVPVMVAAGCARVFQDVVCAGIRVFERETSAVCERARISGLA